MLSKNKLGKTQARAKGIMVNKNKLLNLVADLIDMLNEYGAEHESIIYTLKYYGFTDEQIKEWYGLGE